MDHDPFSLEAAVTKIENSPRTQTEVIKGLSILLRLVTNLVAHPTEEKYKLVSKRNETMAQQLFILDHVHAFLRLIGFEEKDGIYKHSGGDEKMKLLEAAQDFLTTRIRSLELQLKNGQATKNGSAQKSNEVNKAEPEYTYNAAGYFHQTGKQGDKKKNKQEFLLFDKHDINTDKKGSALFSFLKLG